MSRDRSPRLFLSAATVAGLFFVVPMTVLAVTPTPAATTIVPAPTDPSDVAVTSWDGSGTPVQTRRFVPFDDKHLGGSLSVADTGTDGIAEIVVGAPAGLAPTVRILRDDGSQATEFPVYDPGMKYGVTVAAGDLDGDGTAEFVTVPGPGAVTHLVIYDSQGRMKCIAGGFLPFGKDAKTGASVAIADLDNDGKGEIITGEGPSGGFLVKVWKRDGTPVGEFSAFDPSTSSGGVNVAAGDLDGDGKPEIVAVVAAGGGSGTVRVFDGATRTLRYEFMAMADGFKGGLNVAVGDADGDGRKEIIVASAGGKQQVRIFDPSGVLRTIFTPYDPSYEGGVLVAAGRLADGSGIVTRPTGTTEGPPELPKYIHVDISEQRLKAYEYGRLTKTFSVATGLVRHATPLGDFSVLDKPLFVNYRWFYGPDNPDNYDLGIVEWNLRFYPHTYIHYAPWRRVFGVRGSHGCVNVDKTNAEWIYNWADVGTPVKIEQ